MKVRFGLSVIISSLAVAVLLVSLLIACAAPQPAPTPAKPAPTTPTPAAPKPAPSPTPTAPPVAQPKYGGILHTWSTVAWPHWDAHRKPPYAPMFAMLMFNNLIQFDITKKDISPENLVGDLAEKWDVSADGKVITFHLRKGVKWHNGTNFTADDVVYSLTKMADKTRSSLTGDFPSFDKAERVDDYTVKVYLKFPSPSYLLQLAGTYSVIQSKASASIDSKSTDFLMGTGPFKFKKYTSGVSLEVERNSNYFKKDASGKQLPYLDGVTYAIMADKSAVIDALVTQRLDGHGCFLYNNQDEWDRGTSQAKTVQAFRYTPPSLGLRCFNPNFKPFADVRVREALRLTFDNEQSTIAAYGDASWGDYDRTIFTSVYGLPAAEMHKMVGVDKPYADRVAAAKKLMADAGYADGFKMRMVGRTLDVFIKTSEWWADKLRAINVDASIVSRDLNVAREMRDRFDYEVYSDNPLIILGDPDEYASWFKTGGVNNFAKYSNAEADKLWDSQSREMDYPKRKAMTQGIERLLIKDAWYTTGSTKYSSGWQSYVKGWHNMDAIYTQKLKYETLWIDK
ncbi:MAG: ABC transporter substrate-binding protein [Chloroflexota bacterium]